MKTLIKNGLIVDGTGSKGFSGSIAIEDERIIGIGDIESDCWDEIIDAANLVVAPGFIDTHSHSDLKILEDGYIEPIIRQGVTTEILGQDGLSMAPLPKEFIQLWRKNLAGIDGESDRVDWGYETTQGYLREIEKQGISLNQGYLVPHGNIRMEAMGFENRRATEEEIRKMCAITRREMESGAFGLSTGLIYMPCVYSDTRELVELCKVAAEYDGVFAVHQRSEADYILDSMREVLDIGRRSGVKIHFSHFKVCGRKNWPLLDDMVELLDKAAAEGLKVSFDQYPYAAGSTILGVLLPPWAHEGGTDKLLQRLRDPQLRKKMIYDIDHGLPGWDNYVESVGLEQIFVTGVKGKLNADLIGRNMLQIGAVRGKEPLEALLDLVYEEENSVGMVDYYGNEENVIRLLTRPEQNVCTDGILSDTPHPRVYGSFPRVLGHYVRELKYLSLEEAVAKMTSRPAEVFGLSKRGTLKVGNYADIVVFNSETIIDRATFTDAVQFPEGIEYVMINGKVVLGKGQANKVAAGKVLRKVDKPDRQAKIDSKMY